MSTHSTIQFERQADTVILTPLADLGEFNFERFVEEAKLATTLLDMKFVKNVVVDFHRTDYFGSSTIGLFLELRQRVKERNGQMACCGLTQFECEVLGSMNLDTIWQTYATRQEALEAVSKRRFHVLVVDDSEIDRCLVGGLLSKDPRITVSFAVDGEDALTMMSEQIIDLVVSDLMMPRLDGVSLVEVVRWQHPQVPVVVMTSRGNELAAADAVRKGAVSYVPKALQAEKMLPTVRRVLRLAEAFRDRRRLGKCPAKLNGSFFLDNNPESIESLVDLIYEMCAGVGQRDATELLRICVALEEALSNALYHGNLEVGSDAALRMGQRFNESIVADRLADVPEFSERRIVVDASITPHTSRFVIRDDGQGFDQMSVFGKSSADTFGQGKNRGSSLMRMLMDEVVYNPIGNEVTLIKIAENSV